MRRAKGQGHQIFRPYACTCTGSGSGSGTRTSNAPHAAAREPRLRDGNSTLSRFWTGTWTNIQGPPALLLVSVTANAIPDDTSFAPQPAGQVDYLSHRWREEDVWRSWRSMTRQKNEIANGMRLENASWRTWWKQRNKLKTVSPETLNWYVVCSLSGLGRF